MYFKRRFTPFEILFFPRICYNQSIDKIAGLQTWLKLCFRQYAAAGQSEQ